ncbi:DnaJ-domain-containing protein [Ascobolus immersus RN42]|uniref:DnaJ-domain-containing protein n=1 Tax=Ascobolus immersus RN42 TaxID=1160509 RepID=A0A3N4IQ82_ASCIM|nr:DnaJ-domain-containing protein [Ascobolus immersus RN42]
MSNETSTPSDPYKVLGLPKDATESAIRGSYKKLMLQCHPDKVHDESLREEKAKMFEEVQQAYELLSDPRKRKKYDMEASGQRPSPPSGYKHPSYEHTRTRSRSFEDQQADEAAEQEKKRRDRERRLREHEMRARAAEQEASRRAEYERRSREAPRYAHTSTANGYGHSPPKDYSTVNGEVPKSGNAAYDEQLDEELERKREAQRKRGDVPVPAYEPGKLNLPMSAPLGPGTAQAPPEPYDMHGRPMHPGMGREHYPMAREHERAERARRTEEMRPHREPHRETTKSRERMMQEAEQRLREEREMAEKLGKSVPEPRPRRSSAQKEGRPHIATEDLGEKRERRRGTEGATPVDIPPPIYRTENPPHRASVSPPDAGPRGGSRYGSAPAPAPSVVGGPAPKYGSSPQRRHSVSNPAANPDARERIYSQEPGSYAPGDSGYSSPIHTQGYHKEPQEDDDNVSGIGPLPGHLPGHSFRRGGGNFYMSHSERSPISPGGYPAGPSPISPHVPNYPSTLNPGYAAAGYAPSTAGARYGHGVPQVRRSSTVPAPASTVGGDAPAPKTGYARPSKIRESSDSRSQAGSRYGGEGYSERTTAQRASEAAARRGSSAYGVAPTPESPLRSRDYTHMHAGHPPPLARSSTMY